MARIPEIWQADIKTIRIGFFGNYQKTEDINIYWFDHQQNKIISNYTRDYSSSVWIYDAETYKKFAQIYTIISGGWYGLNKRGRWNAFKRTGGEITFEGVLNFNRDKYSANVKQAFNITKQRFSNSIGIEINNESVGHLTFVCKKITFNPSKKISLHHRKENQYIDASEILTNDGLSLVASKFNLHG